MRLHAVPLEETLAARLARAPSPGLRLFWLGQAGFVLEAAGGRLVIDPYLSDSLAEKYRGRAFSHARMMPPPVAAGELGAVDLALATHHHGDHLDAATLRPLLGLNPGARLVAPAASQVLAEERAGVGPERLVLLDAGERAEPLPGIAVTATPAAHETRERDEAGRHRFLGYLVEAEGVRIWHSGDCIPFAGLAEAVASLRPDIALLPVNGRSAELAAQGVPGNFSIREAIDMAATVGAGALIAHHYGMFAFNTAAPAAIDAAALKAPLPVWRAALGTAYECA